MASLTAINRLNYQVNMNASSFSILADEPESIGGDNQGPSPFELLLASLAACTAMTVRMYAKRKNWPVESINLQLDHEKVSANACDDCLTIDGKVDIINIDISFVGDLTEEQIERLKFIAGKCPIHRSLVTETRIRIQ
ncbi:MAG: putative redox protein [Cellvibrionaceae bacterium]|jgi:putative redox protein